MSRFQIKSICNMPNHRVFLPAFVVTVGLCLMIGVSLIATAAPGRFAEDPPARGKANAADSLTKTKGRVREGTRLNDKRGFFTQRGDGATFNLGDGSLKIEGLENLNLERVVRTIALSDKSNEIEWLVSGIVTEFQGGNYLFIDRAIQLSKTPTTAKSR